MGAIFRNNKHNLTTLAGINYKIAATHSGSVHVAMSGAASTSNLSSP